MKRKKFGVSHPAFGVGLGILIVLCYNFFEGFVSPMLSPVFGSGWVWVKQIGLYFFVGIVVKLLYLQLLPKTTEIKPMTPAAFAGLSAEAAETMARTVVAPLPEVSGERQKLIQPEIPLDFSAIENRTRELLALGFAPQIEGAVVSNVKSGAPLFARLLLHPEGAWAQVNQGFPVGAKAMPVSVAFTTYFENDWSVSDSTLKSNYLLWMFRRGKVIGKRHAPESSSAEIWSSHRERCANVAQKLGVSVTHLSYDDYMAQSETYLQHSRRLLIRRSMFVAWLQNLYRQTTKATEWWGDFHQAARNRT